MKSFRSAAVILLVSSFSSIACSGTSVPRTSSPAGALRANSAAVNPIPRPFEKHTLISGNYLNQFIRPEIRAKLDEEPTGDADAGYDPSTLDTAPSSDQSPAESAEAPTDTADQHPAAESDESFKEGARLDTLKFA